MAVDRNKFDDIPASRSFRPRAHDLWAITSYFNPIGYKRRLANYRLFRERLNVPLVAVELTFGLEFELDESDAEILLQLRGGDILWQKERLLNLALQALPSGRRKVVWLDCDVIFEADNWVERTSLLLDRFRLVQPFSDAHLLLDDWRPGEWRPRGSVLKQSAAFLIGSGMPAVTCLRSWSGNGGVYRSLGYAWAASRDLLEEHHLYDACIIGGGDGAIVRAAYGCFEDTIRHLKLDGRPKEHYLRWANAFYDSVRANVGFVEGDLVHLWHGDTDHRRYSERAEGLARFQFDPSGDIAVGDNGAWKWNSDKHDMQDYVLDYFRSRREDG
jgi:hypothetical protein